MSQRLSHDFLDEANVYFPLDKSRIPLEKREDPRVAKMEEEMQPFWQNKEYRLSVCLHEAAHVEYMVRARASRIFFYTQTALYDPQNDKLGFRDAGVEGDWGDNPTPSDSLTIIRWLVAGGAAQRYLIAGPAGAPGDVADREEIMAERSRLGLSAEEVLEYWNQATREVQKDLRSPILRQHLWNAARMMEQSWVEMVLHNDISFELWNQSDMLQR